MSTYTPVAFSVPTGLDEQGLRLGLYRLDGESLTSFRRRLLLETRQPSSPTESGFLHSISRKVGAFDELVGRIAIVSGATPADPRAAITPGRLIIWDDYENDSIEVEVELSKRAVAGYYLDELVTAVDASTNFEWEWVASSSDYEYAYSKKLVVSDNVRISRYRGLPDNFVFEMGELRTGVPRKVWTTNPVVFSNQVADATLIAANGDFALEYDENHRIVITTAVPMKGTALDIQWTGWPWDVRLATVHAWSYNDDDADRLVKDDAFGDDSLNSEVPSHFNAVGSEIAQAVLKAAPIEWGD